MNDRKKLSLRPPTLRIDDGEDPFEDYDKLNRKEPIERLTQLLENVETPFVLGIDSAWGTGKTTFLQLWDWHLRAKGFQTVFFNAWEHDYLDDPLLALLAEITRDTKTGLEQKKETVLKAAGQLLRKSVPVGVRLLSQGLIDLDKGEAAIAEILETAARDKIQELEDSRSTLDDFRKALEDLLDQESDDKPLVFFVDELDRCRPTYAVELLERIKHFFEVRGIVFVFGVNADQLANSVQAIYGHGFDGIGYLRRFFDIVWQLPGPQEERYTKFLMERAGWTSMKNLFGSGEMEFFIDTVPRLSVLLKLSLRQQERCVNTLNLALHSIPPDRYLYPGPLVFFSVLRVWNPRLFAQVLAGGVVPDTALEAMEATAGDEWRRHPDGAIHGSTAWLEATVLNACRYSTRPPRAMKRIDQLKQEAQDAENESLQSKLASWAHRTVELLESDRFETGGKFAGWDTTIRRLGWIGQFIDAHFTSHTDEVRDAE